MVDDGAGVDGEPADEPPPGPVGVVDAFGSRPSMTVDEELPPQAKLVVDARAKSAKSAEIVAMRRMVLVER